MIKSFEQFNSLLRLNESVSISYNELSKILITDAAKYMRDNMWDRSIKLFYGNNYKGNPSTDARMLPSSVTNSNPDGISYGELFADAWEETDGFIGGIIDASFLLKQITDDGEIQRIQDVISGLEKDIVLNFLKSTKIKVKVNASGFEFPISSEDSIKKLAREVLNFFAKKTVKIGETGILSSYGQTHTSKMFDKLTNRDEFIKNTRRAIESPGDFEGDWGLDRWSKYVTEMPGWGKVYQVGDPEKLGYWYSWMISDVIYNGYLTNIGIATLRGIKQMIESGTITVEEINSNTTDVQQQISPAQKEPPKTSTKVSDPVKQRTTTPQSKPKFKKINIS